MVTPESFEGRIERVERCDARVLVRIVIENSDPEPVGAPVVAISLDGLSEAMFLRLCELRDEGEGVYVNAAPGSAVHLHTDHEEELVLEADSAVVTAVSYDVIDYQRLARTNYDRAQEQCRALGKQTAALERVRIILQQQLARTRVKAEHYPPGSTARLLYEKQLALFTRLLAELDA